MQGYCGSINQNIVKMITFLNYLLVLNIFSGGLTLFTSPFEFYFGYTFLLAFLILYILLFRNITCHKTFLAILSILTIFSLVNVYLGKDTMSLLIKQIAGILLNAIAYYLLLNINQYKVERLFKAYLQIALCVAALGIFQELSFLIHFEKGYEYGWIFNKWYSSPATGGMLRVNSVFMEPSHFAIAMAPAMFIAVSRLFKKNSPYLKSVWSSLILITSYLLTFSAIAYFAIALSIVLLLNIKKWKYSLLLIVLVPFLSFAAYRFIPEIRMRVDSTLGVALGSKNLATSHLSVYVVASNAFVAYKSLTDNILFGHGLGSHPVSYDQYIVFDIDGGFWSNKYPRANKADAGSLLLRLLSETGLFGTIAVLYFVFKFRLKMRDETDMTLISNAIFVLLILQLLKQGHYFYNGLFFFVWVYYFAYQIHRQKNRQMLQVKTP